MRRPEVLKAGILGTRPTAAIDAGDGKLIRASRHLDAFDSDGTHVQIYGDAALVTTATMPGLTATGAYVV